MTHVSVLLPIACTLSSFLLCVGCWNGGFYGTTVETDYFLRGGELQGFAGADGADTGLQQAARDLLFGRDYYLGLHRHQGPSTSEQYVLTNGNAFSIPAAPGTSQPDYGDILYPAMTSETGTIQIAGPQAIFALSIASDRPTLTDLSLVGSFDGATAQEMIEDVRQPLNVDTASPGTTQIEWTLTGSRNGAAFSLSFSQTVRAHSRWYSIPI